MSQAAGKKPRGPRLQMNDFASRAAAEGVSGQTLISPHGKERQAPREERQAPREGRERFLIMQDHQSKSSFTPVFSEYVSRSDATLDFSQHLLQSL